MKISYAITVCNEFLEIQKLVPFLLDNKRQQDEIVILYDQKNGNPEVLSYLLKFNKLPNVQTWRGFDFKGHFADWKNKLTEYCNGDYIFQIDADEIPNESLLNNLPLILEANLDNEVYLVPRVNTVVGLTQNLLNKWGWKVNEKGWVNWPDYQTRIYKNTEDVTWMNKVHEKITGYNDFSNFPMEEHWALYHPKKIDRQEKQNNFYETI